MSLSSLLVQREVATFREVEEALARQVLYGGDLITNLFEVCRVDEGNLVPVVAEAFGIPPAPIGELPHATTDATRLVAAEVAMERSMAPISVNRYGLVVAVSEPLPEEVEQELTFALALPIAQHFAPLVRIRQALARDYQIPLDRRIARVLTKIRSGSDRMPSSLPPPRAGTPHQAPPKPPSQRPTPDRKKTEPDLPRVLETFLRDQGEPPRALRRRRGPLTLDVAKQELEEAVERDAILEILFEFARQFFDYTAVFVVHGEIAEGRDAFGEGAARETVARLGVPLDTAGILSAARTAKRLLRQQPADDGIDKILMHDLGRKGGSECAVFPVMVRSRVVALILGDGGGGGIEKAGVDDVEHVIAHSVAAFERLIMRRKLGNASVPPKIPPGIGIVSPGPPNVAERPSVEELAPPIRDLMKEVAGDSKTRTSGTPGTPGTPEVRGLGLGGKSDKPPPANLLQVRRPSGKPIPREDEEGEPMLARRLPLGFTSDIKKDTPMPRSRHRAAAPPLEFGSVPPEPAFAESAFRVDDEEQRLIAEIHGREPVPETTRDPQPLGSAPEPLPPSPRAHSPLPPRSFRDTIASGSNMHLAQPTLPASSDPDKTPIVSLEVDMFRTPIAPPVASHISQPPAPLSNLKQTLPLMAPPSVPAPHGKPIAAPPQPSQPPVSPKMRGTQPMLGAQAGPSVPPTPSPKSRPASVPPPSSGPASERIHHPPAKPPASYDDVSRALPSVIVDVATEYVALVERLLRGDASVDSELVRAGGAAMPALMARFPGPIVIEAERLERGPLPRLAECGPIVRAIAAQRRTALPFVLAYVEDRDPHLRFWATYLLSELVYPDAIDAAIKRSFDEHGQVRLAARAAVRAIAEHHESVIERLGAVACDGATSSERRTQAVEALGETRMPSAVPLIVPLLGGSSDDELVNAARAALVVITRQDFGADANRWSGWWEKNRSRHRIEWLIDALTHDHASIRSHGSEELKALTKEHFGYYDDLSKRERAQAQTRFREWWEGTGRARFTRH